MAELAKLVFAVNHVFDDPTRPFVEQGITIEGIVIVDDVWRRPVPLLRQARWSPKMLTPYCYGWCSSETNQGY